MRLCHPFHTTKMWCRELHFQCTTGTSCIERVPPHVVDFAGNASCKSRFCTDFPLLCMQQAHTAADQADRDAQ